MSIKDTTKQMLQAVFLAFFLVLPFSVSAGSGAWVDGDTVPLSVFVPSANPDEIYSVAASACSTAGGRIPTIYDYSSVFQNKSEFSDSGILNTDYWTQTSPDATHHYTEHMGGFPLYRLNSLDSVERTYFCVKDYTLPEVPPVYDSPELGMASAASYILDLFEGSKEVFGAWLGLIIPLFSVLVVSVVFIRTLGRMLRFLKSLISSAF